MDFSSPSIIWGFTPRKISWHWAATVWLSVAWQPSWSARAWALAGVRFASSTRAPWAPFTAARARAPPIWPVPKNPID